MLPGEFNNSLTIELSSGHEMVSIFPYYCDKSFFAESGGFIRGLNCSSAYGEKGAEATGTLAAETAVTVAGLGEMLKYATAGFVGAATESDESDTVSTSGTPTAATITGVTSGATATIESISTQSSEATTSITTASPGVVTFPSPHNLKEGQQITFDAISAEDSGVAITPSTVFTVRNPLAGEFELFKADGITPTNINQYTSSANAVHGVVIVSNVQGTFVAGETITGGTSGNTANIQNDILGFKGVTSYDFPQVKQIGMAGSPTFTADTSIDATNGSNAILSGSISVSGNV